MRIKRWNQSESLSARSFKLSLLVLPLIFSLPSHANLSSHIAEAKGEPAIIESSIGQWTPADERKLSEDTYRVRPIDRADYAAQMGLIDPNLLENAYFKIVENETDATLPVGDFDGANVLYHLMKARAYYSRLAGDTGIASLALDRKISVRVRVDHAYNLVTHFAEIEDYNNSRYIPPNFKGKWGSEIWFDKLKSSVERVDWYNLTMCAGAYLKGNEWKALAIVAPLEIFKHYNAGIDGAKIPDVIYHEAFHWASDSEGLFPMAADGNPVSEDYANYFASSLNGRPLIAEIDEFTSRYYKRSFEEVRDIKGTSSMKYNSTTFGPAIFWQIRNLLGQARADRLIWSSMRELKGSYKHGDVPAAVLTAASNDRSITLDEFNRIRALFEAHLRSYERLQLKFNPLEPVTDKKGLLPPGRTEQPEELISSPSAPLPATSPVPSASQAPSLISRGFPFSSYARAPFMTDALAYPNQKSFLNRSMTSTKYV